MLRKWAWTGLVWSGSEWGQVAGRWERGNGRLVSVKYGVFLDWLRNCFLLKKSSTPWSCRNKTQCVDCLRCQTTQYVAQCPLLLLGQLNAI